MTLYVNGDSHSAGAEAVNNYCFAADDSAYYQLGRRPHPDNLRASYAQCLANCMDLELHCDAESASSNSRIIRTTKQYLETHTPDLVVIGWSTWEREEWLYDGTYWQVNAGGVGHDWPDAVKQNYQQYVISIDWHERTRIAHEQIHRFHSELLDRGIPHLFFNTYNHFANQQLAYWHNSYVNPYDSEMTYWQWLTNQGYRSNGSYHFRADAHKKWADFLLSHLTRLL